MKDATDVSITKLTGDELLAALSALANPHRLRIVASLTQGRNYVSQLARDLGIGRPLLHMHLQRLETAGLVTSRLELSEDGKAMRYFEVAPFLLDVSPAGIAAAVETLSNEPPGDAPARTKSEET
jgi:predicted transcriptional regulator